MEAYYQQLQEQNLAQEEPLPQGQQEQFMNTRNQLNNMSNIMQVVSGKQHEVHFTKSGEVFSFGSSKFSAAGQGGSKELLTPSILKPLLSHSIEMIACGEHHTLALTKT